jgi:putative ABC transport system permease protein
MRGNGPIRRWSRIFKQDARAEVEDELAFHLEQRIQSNIARGMDPDSARLAAQKRLGDLGLIESECAMLLRAERRAEARSYFMKMSWLDFRLGFRMLIKYPGLTIVGGLAIALAIAVSAFAFEFGTQVMAGKLPFPDGDRVVALRLWHLPSSGVEEQSMYDYSIWRAKLKSVVELGAYREVERNLVTPDGQADGLRIAEISPSAFRLADVRPLLGRPLLESDEQANAQPVLVIGERVWKRFFASDPAVIGQTVRLGTSQSTIVGVMPEDFAFPIGHSAWAPLRLDWVNAAPRKGTALGVFGRLAPGTSLQQAQAELDVLGAQLTAAHPETHEHIRPQVMPYARAFFPVSWSTIASVAVSSQGGVLLFLVLMCANVATLVLARTATRENEIVVRSALGASRGRIVTQLLAEMLVLGGLAAMIGLSVVGFATRTALGLIEAEGQLLPFWIRGQLSMTTVLYAAILTIVAAAIAGVIPALKVTRGLAQRLRQAGVGGNSLQFGKTWTGLIVTQVALTVVFMTLALDAQQDLARARAMQLGFPAQEYLYAQLEMHRDLSRFDAPNVPFAEDELARYQATFKELEQRLRTEPSVEAMTFALQYPGMYHERNRVEAEGAAADPKSGPGHQVEMASVSANYFDALHIPVVAGRAFQPGDLGTRVVIVNETMARQMFGNVNAAGRRIRYVCEDETCYTDPRNRSEPATTNRWYEIAGVVKDIAMTGDPDLIGRPIGGLYHLWAPGSENYLARIAVQVRGNPQEFAPRLRAIATAVDPSMRLESIQPLDKLYHTSLHAYDVWFRFAIVACSIVLLLSVAGIYSIMAFTVARRTREIGIRAALGGDRHRILWDIFSRSLIQVMLGVGVGGAFVLGMMGGIKSSRGLMLFLVPLGIVLAVCALACVVPTRRALRVQPTQALSSGG